MLTKNSYLQYLNCPNEFWLAFHSPAPSEEDLPLAQKHRRQQGFEVLRLAKKMSIFNGGSKGIVEFGRIFSTEHITTSADITLTDPATGDLSIYEVKSGSKIKDEHYDDLAFQKMAAEILGHTVAKTYVITVNTAYTRNGEIEPDRLLKIHDVTNEVAAKQDETIENTKAAIGYLTTQPVPELKLHCSKKLDCGFIRYHFKDIPVYNVTHISRLNAQKCAELVELGILDIRSVPDDFKLSDKQRKQVETARAAGPKIDREAIRRTLDGLKYPLHFLDYESFSHAVPKFHGTRPYQQMVFQYSLHTIEKPGAEPVHSFHLSKNDGAFPARETAEHLRAQMSSKPGTTIVWNAAFEKTRNRELGEMFPELAEFFSELNESVFDLETIFIKDLYRHPGFLGKTSIKNIQPVLFPKASYHTLDIPDGTTAAIRWFQMATKITDAAESEKIFQDLCTYCHLDTLAMVEIFKTLRDL
ncbi:MAG: DUF2779 domain-containing protein [Acidobacteria bacterium]|nr:DUF2779 domain-containing protein [Acidobacteriota bacterium]